MDMFSRLDAATVVNDWISPVEDHNGILVKRDDTFEVFGVKGGKARSAYYLISSSNEDGAVTGGMRASPQVGIVSAICKGLDKKCVVWANKGSVTPELQFAIDNGAELRQTNTQWNSGVKGAARKEAEERGWLHVPFGMECLEAPIQTALQVKNLKDYDFKRLVIPVGSAMSFAGVLWGLKYFDINVPVLGVRVGAAIDKVLNTYAPLDWAAMAEIVPAEQAYGDYVKEPYLDSGLVLDPVYEAKCLPFLEKGDLLWVVGIRDSWKGQK